LSRARLMTVLVRSAKQNVRFLGSHAALQCNETRTARTFGFACGSYLNLDDRRGRADALPLCRKTFRLFSHTPSLAFAIRQPNLFLVSLTDHRNAELRRGYHAAAQGKCNSRGTGYQPASWLWRRILRQHDDFSNSGLVSRARIRAVTGINAGDASCNDKTVESGLRANERYLDCMDRRRISDCRRKRGLSVAGRRGLARSALECIG
jgi:hypothetical protein